MIKLKGHCLMDEKREIVIKEKIIIKPNWSPPRVKAVKV